MKVINLKDKYNPKDSLSHGQVKCFDASGNKIFDKSNMIVRSGRIAIKNAVKKLLIDGKMYIGTNGTIPSAYNMVIVDDGSNVKLATKYDADTILPIKDDNDSDCICSINDPIMDYSIDANPVLSSSGELSDSTAKLLVDGQEYLDPSGNFVLYKDKNADPSVYETPDSIKDFIRIVVTLETTGSARQVNELGIIFKDTDNDTWELFSRVCFDKLTVDDQNSYTLIYYLYF